MLSENGKWISSLVTQRIILSFIYKFINKQVSRQNTILDWEYSNLQNDFHISLSLFITTTRDRVRFLQYMSWAASSTGVWCDENKSRQVFS